MRVWCYGGCGAMRVWCYGGVVLWVWCHGCGAMGCGAMGCGAMGCGAMGHSTYSLLNIHTSTHKHTLHLK